MLHFVRYFKYVAATSLYILPLSSSENLCWQMFTMKWGTSVLCGRFTWCTSELQFRQLVGYMIYIGQTFVYLQCNLSYEIRKLPWRIKTL